MGEGAKTPRPAGGHISQLDVKDDVHSERLLAELRRTATCSGNP